MHAYIYISTNLLYANKHRWSILMRLDYINLPQASHSCGVLILHDSAWSCHGSPCHYMENEKEHLCSLHMPLITKRLLYLNSCSSSFNQEIYFIHFNQTQPNINFSRESSFFKRLLFDQKMKFGACKKLVSKRDQKLLSPCRSDCGLEVGGLVPAFFT